jgi:hypothetical protein
VWKFAWRAPRQHSNRLYTPELRAVRYWCWAARCCGAQRTRVVPSQSCEGGKRERGMACTILPSPTPPPLPRHTAADHHTPPSTSLFYFEHGASHRRVFADACLHDQLWDVLVPLCGGCVWIPPCHRAASCVPECVLHRGGRCAGDASSVQDAARQPVRSTTPCVNSMRFFCYRPSAQCLH